MINKKINIKNRIIDEIIFETIDSTNDYLYKNINEFTNDTLVISYEQTNGHGTNDRKFISYKDKGIYFSLLLNYTDDKHIKYITEKTAVAIYNSLKDLYHIETKIKWVNDIYYYNKKVCGILCKNSIYNKKVIIGIGIDLYKNENMDEEIKDIAGYIFDDKIDEHILIYKIIENIYEKITETEMPKLYIEKRIII